LSAPRQGIGRDRGPSLAIRSAGCISKRTIYLALASLSRHLFLNLCQPSLHLSMRHTLEPGSVTAQNEDPRAENLSREDRQDRGQELKPIDDR